MVYLVLFFACLLASPFVFVRGVKWATKSAYDLAPLVMLLAFVIIAILAKGNGN